MVRVKVQMGRIRLVAFFTWFLIVSDVSDSASLVMKVRELIGLESAPASTVQLGSPSPTPVPITKQLNPKPTDGVKEGKPDPAGAKRTPKDDVNGGNGVIAPPPVEDNEKGSGTGDNNKKDGVTKEEKTKDNVTGDKNEKEGGSQGNGTGENKEKDDGNKVKDNESGENKKKNIGSGDNNKKDDVTEDNQEKRVETCGRSAMICPDLDKVSACLRSSESGSKSSYILVENGGNVSLTAKLTVGTNVKELNVPKQKLEKINITLITSESMTLILYSGSGNCVLQMGILGAEQNFLRFPSYEKLMTPVNGAYFFILTVLIFGGTWACCKLKKKSRHDGVPYQELEMGIPQSASAVDVETADGWDESWNDGWDDDWSEDNAVKSPAVRHEGSISAYDLTSRSSNRDGWENNWDE